MAEVQAELQAVKASRQRHAEQLKDQVTSHKLDAHITCCAALSIAPLDVAQHADGCRRTYCSDGCCHQLASSTSLACISSTRDTAPAMQLVRMATAMPAFLALPAER